MSDSLIAVLICAGLVVICWVVVQILYKIMCWINKRIDAKRRKEHFKLYLWFDDYFIATCAVADWRNGEIRSREKKIDTILKEINYLPAELREKKEIELEELRDQLYLAKCNVKVLDFQVKEIREKIHQYVTEHNLTWAKKQGW